MRICPRSFVRKRGFSVQSTYPLRAARVDSSSPQVPGRQDTAAETVAAETSYTMEDCWSSVPSHLADQSLSADPDKGEFLSTRLLMYHLAQHLTSSSNRQT